MFFYFNTLFGKIDIALNDYSESIECKKQSERLVFEIEKTLKKNKLEYKDVVFSTINGPGNFTSIKTNLAVIKAIKLATGNDAIVSNIFDIMSFNEDYDYIAIKINPTKYYVKSKSNTFFVKQNIDDLQGKILTEFSIDKWKQLTNYKFKNNIFNEFEPLYIENASITLKKN
jgi:tRNA A37 threonylcarbamoyladenosine modification protein TsaB